MLNKFMGIGRLTRDVEIRYIASGTAVANFGMAFNTKYGEKESVLFLDIVAWAKLGETVSKYIGKGSLIYIEGRLDEREWQSDSGTRKKMELIAESVKFLDSKGRGNSSTPPKEVSDIEPF